MGKGFLSERRFPAVGGGEDEDRERRDQNQTMTSADALCEISP